MKDIPKTRWLARGVAVAAAVIMTAMGAEPATGGIFRVRLESWEVPAVELVQRMTGGGDLAKGWLEQFRGEALMGKIPGVKLLASPVLAVDGETAARQESLGEETFPMEYDSPELPEPAPAPGSKEERIKRLGEIFAFVSPTS